MHHSQIISRQLVTVGRVVRISSALLTALEFPQDKVAANFVAKTCTSAELLTVRLRCYKYAHISDHFPRSGLSSLFLILLFAGHPEGGGAL